jgi:hypothetical protein
MEFTRSKSNVALTANLIPSNKSFYGTPHKITTSDEIQLFNYILCFRLNDY